MSALSEASELLKRAPPTTSPERDALAKELRKERESALKYASDLLKKLVEVEHMKLPTAPVKAKETPKKPAGSSMLKGLSAGFLQNASADGAPAAASSTEAAPNELEDEDDEDSDDPYELTEDDIAIAKKWVRVLDRKKDTQLPPCYWNEEDGEMEADYEIYGFVLLSKKQMALLETIKINGNEMIAACDDNSPWLRVFSYEHDQLFYWNTQTNEASWKKPRTLQNQTKFPPPLYSEFYTQQLPDPPAMTLDEAMEGADPSMVGELQYMMQQLENRGQLERVREEDSGRQFIGRDGVVETKTERWLKAQRYFPITHNRTEWSGPWIFAKRPDALRKQIEYYLSDENLSKNARGFYRRQIEASHRAKQNGWFDMSNLITAPRLMDGNVTIKQAYDVMKESYEVEVKMETESDEKSSSNSGRSTAARRNNCQRVQYWIRRKNGNPPPAVGSFRRKRNNQGGGGGGNGRRGGGGGGGGGSSFPIYKSADGASDDADSDVSDDFGHGMYGFSASDCDELMMQGIKPWDDEAGDALAVLNGYW